MTRRPRPAIAWPLLIPLAACGGSDSDPALPPADDPGGYLIGGTVCLDSGEPTSLDTPSGGGRDDLVDCSELPRTDLASSGLQPTGRGSLRFDANEYVLDSGISVETTAEEDPSGRARTRLILHDGETRVETVGDSMGNVRTDYAVHDARVSISFSLYPGSGTDAAGRTYEHLSAIEPDGPASSGRNVSADAVLVVDSDGDATVSAGEFFLLSSGQIVWSDDDDRALITFNFTTEEGLALEGTFEGGLESVR